MGGAVGWPRARRAAGLVPAADEGRRGGAGGIEISPFGLHWRALDEDVSVEGLLAGRGDQRRMGKVA